jgi:glycerophosphoryl diester phosphodiesterase
MGAGVGRKVAAIPFAVLAFASAAHAAVPASFVQAHRGGPIETVKGKQVPEFGEETMPAFKAAADAGYVLELDAKLSADGVPMVIHDGRLDRTTTCDGLVADRTAAQIRADCRVDVLGTGDVTKQLGPRSKKLQRVPTLMKVLRFADRARAELNLEVKNVPTDPDFDPGTGYARTVAETIRDSGFPVRRLIVQAFIPSNLDVFAADPYFDRAELSMLVLGELNAGSSTFAASQGYDWVSPEWPSSEASIDEAHGLGLKVVPYTLNSRGDVGEAARFGVDAVITDDPGMALRAAKAAGG